MGRENRVQRILPVAACVLVIGAALKIGLPSGASNAVASGPADPPTALSATAQRAEQRRELEDINRRLASIEKLLQDGLKVKVTEMPAVRVEKDEEDE